MRSGYVHALSPGGVSAWSRAVVANRHHADRTSSHLAAGAQVSSFLRGADAAVSCRRGVVALRHASLHVSGTLARRCLLARHFLFSARTAKASREGQLAASIQVPQDCVLGHFQSSLAGLDAIKNLTQHCVLGYFQPSRQAGTLGERVTDDKAELYEAHRPMKQIPKSVAQSRRDG